MTSKTGNAFSVKAAAVVVAFCCGAAVLMQELLVAGWMAPLYGNGIGVWATILGVTLLSMAAGYAAGARKAGVTDGGSIMAVVMGVAAAGTLIAAALVRLPVAHDPRLLSDGWMVVTAGLLLALPVGMSAAVSPWIVEVCATGGGMAPGRASGMISAASTLGGVSGALLSGLWLIPAFGLWHSTLALAGIFCLAGAACAAMPGGRASRSATVIAVVLILAAACHGCGRRWAAGGASSGARLLLREESWYGTREVRQDVLARHLFLNGMRQSWMPMFGEATLDPSALLLHGYPPGLLPFLMPGRHTMLIVGLGGGLLNRCFTDYGWDVESVEMDPGMLPIARRHFRFEGACHIGDGRNFIARSGKSYDVILSDASSGENIPPHLCTKEYFDLVRRRLAPGGVFMTVVIGAIGCPDTDALVRTFATVFPDAVILSFARPDTLGPMCLYSDGGRFRDPQTRAILRGRGLRLPFDTSVNHLDLQHAAILTDDRNPIALWRRQTAREWRATILKVFSPATARNPSAP